MSAGCTPRTIPPLDNERAQVVMPPFLPPMPNDHSPNTAPSAAAVLNAVVMCSSLGLALEPLTNNKARSPRATVDVPGKPLWCIPRMRCENQHRRLECPFRRSGPLSALCTATDSSSYSRMSSAMKLCMSFCSVAPRACCLSFVCSRPLCHCRRGGHRHDGRKWRIPDTITTVVAFRHQNVSDICS